MKKHLENQFYRDGRKRWTVARLIKLAEDLKPFELPLKHMNINGLYPEIKSTMEFVEHIQYVIDADLSCPIILDEEGYVMDGRHRLAKCLLNNKKTIKAVRFDVSPDPCYYESDD